MLASYALRHEDNHLAVLQAAAALNFSCAYTKG